MIPAARARGWLLEEREVLTELANGRVPDPKDMDADGQRLVAAWKAKGRPDADPYVRPSRACPKEKPDERVSRPLTKDEERTALEMLSKRFVPPALKDSRKCMTCGSRCRCDWRNECWLELVSPRESVAPIEDLEMRVDRAVGRAESRKKRAWGKL